MALPQTIILALAVAVRGQASVPPPGQAAGGPSGFSPKLATQVPDRLSVVRRLLRDGQFAAAIPVAQAAVAAAPEDLRARFFLGLCLHKAKRYGEALPLLESVASAPAPGFPEAPHAVHYLGWCRYYLGDLPGARAAFQAHANAFPNYDDSHFGLGLVAFDEDRIAEAEQSFRRALELLGEQQGAARERAKNLARLGDVLLRQDRLPEAEQSYRRAVELHEDHYEAWAKLARLLDRLGRTDEAAAARARQAMVMARLGKDAPRG